MMGGGIMVDIVSAVILIMLFHHLFTCLLPDITTCLYEEIMIILDTIMGGTMDFDNL
jgi:hypothetical protein